MDNKNNFKFFIPAELVKSTSENGEEVMKIKGIASTPNKDSQGEYLDPSGMDLTAFQWINWNHKGKDDPSDIIGEPTLAQVNGENQLYIEGVLYPEVQKARATWALMKALSKSRAGNKLGLSVEGKVVERDPSNQQRITKSKIVGVAICPVPINGDTWVDLLQKGYTKDENELEYDEDTEKAITVAANPGITMESVEGGQKVLKKKLEDEEKEKKLKKLSKSDIFNQIFFKFKLDYEIAKSVYNIITNISTMSNRTEITQEDINKALQLLEIAKSSNEVVSNVESIEKSSHEESVEDKEEEVKPEMEAPKEVENEVEEKEEDELDSDMVNKAVEMVKKMKAEGCDKDMMMKSLMKKGYGEAIVAKAIDAVSDASENKDGGEVAALKVEMEEVKKSFEDIKSILNDVVESSTKKFEATSTLYKSLNAEKDSLKKSLEEVTIFNNELKAKLKMYETTPNPKKSLISKSFNEKFEKSEDGKEVYNIASKLDRKKLSDKLEEMSGINKSENFDKELMKAAQNLELGGNIEPRTISRLNAMNITVIGN